MIQNIVIILLFLAAIGYIARLIYLHFRSESSCPKGCGSCSAMDIDKIKKELEQKNA